ncbi:sulfatase-like hydrolase/transferase [Marinicella meishanensis]|uniref:sulfatase-like hydrolase/transferase n=1 Tax=Marinicella meishanensis TaxID=2873263 RepID=UPI001CBD3698|nr:sulfatase-like hydrolase/transferase [Marinicella sp. NBU2979]
MRRFNFILITLDSCRWDSFELADTPFFDSTGFFKKAHSQATYTMPSHLSMFSGIFPHVEDRIPYYNRFEKNLLWLVEPRKNIEALIDFENCPKDMIEGFGQMGMDTVGVGAMQWFKSPILTEGFQQFNYTGIHARQQIEYLMKSITNDKAFFHMLNLGETHDPYEFGGQVSHSNEARYKMRNQVDVGFDQASFDKQIESVHFLDGVVEEYLSFVARTSEFPSIVVICSDHGECFGEDGMYGHGFYHPKIMEVPLAIFKIENGKIKSI